MDGQKQYVVLIIAYEPYNAMTRSAFVWAEDPEHATEQGVDMCDEDEGVLAVWRNIHIPAKYDSDVDDADWYINTEWPND